MGKKAKLSAKAQLADFALSTLEKASAVEKPSAQSLVLAAEPLSLIQWDTATFRELGTTRCNRALQDLRNLRFPLRNYRELAACFKRGIREIPERIPSYWSLRTPIFRKFKLHDLLGWGALVALTGSLETVGVLMPIELAAHSETSAVGLAEKFAEPPGLESVWLAAKCFVEDSGLETWESSMRPGSDALDLIPDLRSGAL